MSDLRCKHCNRPSDPRWESKYGCCFECWNNGVDEFKERIAELEAEVARLRAALEMAEWGAISFDGTRDRCPVCGAVKVNGHFPGCAVAAEALTRKEG